ncbi:MAG: SurA N-terminal domain-containing protein [Nitrosomonadales bacterium]|nr:SurA N-terminal domain-containing protein [Nitrosomonadales bacterium]
MFDFVHENKRLVQIVLAVIILPFALWGVSSYDKAGNSAGVIATVSGDKITQQEFENTLLQQQERLRQQLGANFDASMFDNPEMRRAVLDNLISQHLLVERAKAAKLVVPDDQVAQLIAGIEAFQDGGKFDKKRYESALASKSMSPLMFEARVRDDLLGQQMQNAYAQNGFAANSVTDNVIRLNEQQRIVSVSPVSIQTYMSQVKVDEAEIKKYYEQNSNAFQVQEQAKVEYVKFSVDDLQAKAEVSKEDVRKYYDEHQSDFGTSEERHAAHILIAAGASQAEQDAARTKAEQLLAQLKQSPATFAELAKKNSQDPGSATNGGDLGFFGRGMMVKPFDDAVFALKVGEISGLVKSNFGYHIIKLIAVNPPKVLSFDKARGEIENKLRKQKAGDMFAEMAEKFSNAVYEQSDTLKPAADLVGAKIEHSGWLSKGSPAGTPWTAKMLQAIFNDEIIKNKRNTAAIEVAANTLVAARIAEYKPASVLPLSEVQEAISQKLQRQQALELAVKQGKAMLEQLQGGNKVALSWGPAQSVTRSQRGALDAGLVRQIFQASVTKLPQFVGAETAQNGYMLVRIDAVKEGDAISEQKRSSYAQQLRQLTGEEMSRAYMADAKQQATIKSNLPEKVSPQP